MSLFLNRNVDYFIKIVSTGSFKEAASLLNLSQPALSIAIKNFEAEIGTALFLRDKKNAALTTHGLKLYEKLVHLQKVVTLETSSILGQEHIRRFRIGSIPWFSTSRLLPYLNKNENKIVYDYAQFFIRPAGIILKAVENGLIDFAFINWPSKPKLVHSHFICADPAVVGGLRSRFAHIEKAKSYADLDNEPWIYREGRGNDWTNSIHWDKSGFVASDVYTMKSLLLGGYGIYEFQLAYFTKQEQAQLSFVKFPTRFSENAIYAVWRKDLDSEAKQILDSAIVALK